VPTVYLHPIGLDARLWRDIAGPDDVALNLPGFGGTPAPDGGPSFPALVEFALRGLREPADLVGVSLGSMVAQHAALLRPDMVRSVLLACGGAATDPETSRGRARAARETGMAGVLPSTLDRWFTPEALAADGHPGVAYARDRLLADDPEVFAAYWEMMAGHDLTEALRDVTVPATVLAAVDDLAAPVVAMKDLADRVPGARFEVIAGPHIVPLENRAGFTDAVRRHLALVAT
jgi:pimeloyl-ACP methyl ester carboxylesterase